MEQLYSEMYEVPFGYEEEDLIPLHLAGFNFTVTDAATGNPVPGALCAIHAGPDGTGDADTVLTDNQGKAGIDAKWFAPKSWSVSKEGYLTKLSNQMASTINVALESTAVPPNGEPPTPPPAPEFPWMLPASLVLGIIMFATGTKS